MESLLTFRTSIHLRKDERKSNATYSNICLAVLVCELVATHQGVTLTQVPTWRQSKMNVPWGVRPRFSAHMPIVLANGRNLCHVIFGVVPS